MRPIPACLLLLASLPLAASPRFPIPKKPSLLVQELPTLLVLAELVAPELRMELARSSATDRETRLALHSGLYTLALLRGDQAAAQGHLDRARELQENPVRRLSTGLLSGPLIGLPAQDPHGAYRARLRRGLEALPCPEARFTLEALLGGQRSLSRESILAQVAASLDPVALQGELGRDEALSLLNSGLLLHRLLPYRPDAVACLEPALKACEGQPARRPAPHALEVKARGPFFGQGMPGPEPQPFAPEVLKAISPWVEGIAFSPDGLECFLHVGDADYSGAQLYRSRCVAGVWTPLEIPAFLEGFEFSAEAAYAPDGSSLRFTARRPGGSVDLWTVTRKGGDWGEPTPLPAPNRQPRQGVPGQRHDAGRFLLRLGPGIAGHQPGLPRPAGCQGRLDGGKTGGALQPGALRRRSLRRAGWPLAGLLRRAAGGPGPSGPPHQLPGCPGRLGARPQPGADFQRPRRGIRRLPLGGWPPALLHPPRRHGRHPALGGGRCPRPPQVGRFRAVPGSRPRPAGPAHRRPRGSAPA